MAICSVLVVDDNEDDRYILKRHFKRSKIRSEVYEAENGQVAYDFLSDFENNSKKYPDSFPPHLIFLDINMPVMDGFEFLEVFRELKASNDKLHTIVFAMFTSSDREEDVQRANQYDFVDGFVTKGTFTLDNLVELVKEKFPDIEYVE